MESQRFLELRELAQQLGLDFFDVIFEVVPQDIMSEIAAYGLPTRARHWSYGKVYNRQRVHGQMGLSKIYEIVLNNDPGYAFLLDTNSAIANLLVAAHVYAHCDFFKQKVYFSPTNRNMVNVAVEHALRIDEYNERYGLDRVEQVMDIAFAVDRHIDLHKGLVRKPYPARQVIERERQTRIYADLFGKEEFALTKVVVGDSIPPYPEKISCGSSPNMPRLSSGSGTFWRLFVRHLTTFIRSLRPRFSTKVGPPTGTPRFSTSIPS